jgi:hypothetical protein
MRMQVNLCAKVGSNCATAQTCVSTASDSNLITFPRAQAANLQPAAQALFYAVHVPHFCLNLFYIPQQGYLTRASLLLRISTP